MTKQPLNKEFIMNAAIDNYDEFKTALEKAQSAATTLRVAIDEMNMFIPQLVVIDDENETNSNSESSEKK